MKEYYLNYYPLFKCVANRCKHTCCAGWEMDIDKTTLQAYKNESSNFKTTLHKGINFKKSTFKIDKNKRCAFLDSTGLCKIITNLGEDKLCQICRDHPRFKSYFDDRIETGLGFCCEEATRLILSFTDKITPTLFSDDNENVELDFNQKIVLEFREKLLNALQDRLSPINDRILTILKLCNVDFSDKDYLKIIKKYLSFERLNKNWTKRLNGIKSTPFTLEINEHLTVYCEQFLANSFYRHLSDAEDINDAYAIALACVLGWFIIQNVCLNEVLNVDYFSVICDVVREYSEEVEYSQKNLNKLFNFAYKFIKY